MGRASAACPVICLKFRRKSGTAVNNNHRGFKLTPLCAALCAVIAGNAYGNDDITAPKVVIPRMISAQAALNATQGGQLTLITSNGVLQGPAASMLQVIAPQTAIGSTPSTSHAAIVAGVLRNVQSGAVIPQPQIAPGSTVVMPNGVPNAVSIGTASIGGLPIAPVIASGSAMFNGGLPINVTGTPTINWNSFNISSGSAAGFTQNSGSVTLNTVRQLGAGTITGVLVSNGVPVVLSPSGASGVAGMPVDVTGLSNIRAGGSPTIVPAGALTLTGAGTGGVGGVTGFSSSKPVVPVTVR